MSTLRIGDLARVTGTKVVTIRYYEETGLVPQPFRSASGQRLYGEVAVRRLRFIRRARRLGFPPERVRDLLDLAGSDKADCTPADTIAAAQLADIEERIADLQALAQELRTTLACCSGNGPVAKCRVIEALGGA